MIDCVNISSDDIPPSLGVYSTLHFICLLCMKNIHVRVPSLYSYHVIIFYYISLYFIIMYHHKNYYHYKYIFWDFIKYH